MKEVIEVLKREIHHDKYNLGIYKKELRHSERAEQWIKYYSDRIEQFKKAIEILTNKPRP